MDSIINELRKEKRWEKWVTDELSEDELEKPEKLVIKEIEVKSDDEE